MPRPVEGNNSFQAGDSITSPFKNSGNPLANSAQCNDRSTGVRSTALSMADRRKASRVTDSTSAYPMHPWTKRTWATCDIKHNVKDKEGKSQRHKIRDVRQKVYQRAVAASGASNDSEKEDSKRSEPNPPPLCPLHLGNQLRF